MADMGFFGRAFDFDRDGKMGAFERAADFNAYMHLIKEKEDEEAAKKMKKNTAITNEK